MPLQILPGTTYLLSRRCTQRQFLLKPSKATNLILAYCMAVAVEKYGVIIHCVDVLSNHMHTVLTDPKGSIPDFMQYMHRLVGS